MAANHQSNHQDETPRDPRTGRYVTREDFAQIMASQRSVQHETRAAVIAVIVAIAVIVMVGFILGKHSQRQIDLLREELAQSGHVAPLRAAAPSTAGVSTAGEKSPWNPGPYYPPQPSYRADYIVTGEAQRQTDGQLRLTLGFYPKGGANPYWMPGETDPTLKLEPEPEPIPPALCPCGCGKPAAECRCADGDCKKPPSPIPDKTKPNQ